MIWAPAAWTQTSIHWPLMSGSVRAVVSTYKHVTAKVQQCDQSAERLVSQLKSALEVDNEHVYIATVY